MITAIVFIATSCVVGWAFVRSDQSGRKEPEGISTSCFYCALFLLVLLLRAYFDIPNEKIGVVLAGVFGGFVGYVGYDKFWARKVNQH